VLEQVSEVLATIDNREFQVAGHTDNVPIHTSRFPSNWELSTARAVNVVKLMMEQGLEPARLSAAGYADTQPIGSNDDDEGRQQNRRIEISLVPNLDELPDLSALQI
jgi:chemotaxis protein MotB